MADVFCIAKWDDVFENATSRKLQSLSWIAFPVDMDSKGYLSLVSTFGEEAPTIYGAWAALLCVAAKCSRRGTLAHSNGEPKSLAHIAVQARFPISIMQRMFDWAVSKDVSWIELVEPSGESANAAAEIAGDPPEICHAHDTTDTTGKDITQHDTESETGGRAGGRECGGRKIVMGPGHWREITPMMDRIARVVTKDSDIRATKLRDADFDLCAVAAALDKYHFTGKDLLGKILKSVSDRKEPADKPWGHFRGCLAKAAQRLGQELHEIEGLVILPKRAGKPAAPAVESAGVSP